MGGKTKKRREREDGILISNYDMNFVCGGDAFCFSGKRFQDERRALGLLADRALLQRVRELVRQGGFGLGDGRALRLEARDLRWRGLVLPDFGAGFFSRPLKFMISYFMIIHGYLKI